MKTSLKARLEETIEKWVDTNCDKPDWVGCWVTDDLANRMTTAAVGVLEAMEEHEHYLAREDRLK